MRPSRAERRAALGLSETLVRLSPGIEDADDLVDDLRRGLDGLARARREAPPLLEARA